MNLSEDDCDTLTRGHCPACHERGFVIGPQAPPSINIECANVECRARFNIAPFGGKVLMAHHIPRESEGGHRWPSAPATGVS